MIKLLSGFLLHQERLVVLIPLLYLLLLPQANYHYLCFIQPSDLRVKIPLWCMYTFFPEALSSKLGWPPLPCCIQFSFPQLSSKIHICTSVTYKNRNQCPLSSSFYKLYNLAGKVFIFAFLVQEEKKLASCNFFCKCWSSRMYRRQHIHVAFILLCMSLLTPSGTKVML